MTDLKNNVSWAFLGGKPEALLSIKVISDILGSPVFLTPPKDLPRKDRDDLSALAKQLNTEYWESEKSLKSLNNIDIAFSQRFQVIPMNGIRLPRLGIINAHASLLPLYRGVHPISWAIINGERFSGSTLHLVTKDVDAGPIIYQQKVQIGLDDDLWEVTDKIAGVSSTLFARLAKNIKKNQSLPPTKKQTKSHSIAPRRRPEDSIFVPSQTTYNQLVNLMRALPSPLPPASFVADNGKLITVRNCSSSFRSKPWFKLKLEDSTVWVL